MLLFGASPLLAWGPRGHRVVARIAEEHLHTDARRQVRVLLGSDDLASISTWADDIRRSHPETARWHFVDVPLGSSGFSGPRDCPPSRQALQDQVGNCVVARIRFFARVLADRRGPIDGRAEALKFLVHLVADAHQPMHAVADADAGNRIRISELGRTECGTRACNLHLLWDTGILQHPRRPEREQVAEIERLIAREELERRPVGTPESWADESFRVAGKVWLKDGAQVDESYFKTNIPVAEGRLALAGIRLAALLNAAFSDHANHRYSMK
jgi:hypothetical protein